MKFHLPDTRDRAFTELGDKHYVNVDISILEDTLGFDSHLPCNSSVNEGFDECTYDQVKAKILHIFFNAIFLHLN